MQSEAPFIHSHAIVDPGATIGGGSRVWAFAHILGGAKIGERANICDHVFIENDVIVGDDVTIKCGVQLWDGLRVEDGVFIGPNASFANDLHPRSKVWPERFETTVLRQGCSIGSGAVVLPGVVIGRNAIVGAGAVVTQNVPDRAVVVGNPAQVRSYAGVDHDGAIADGHVKAPTSKDVMTVSDLRGSMTAINNAKLAPFEVKRIFFVYSVPSGSIRGEHAHRSCHQYLVCLQGTVRVVREDLAARTETVLNAMAEGVHVPPMMWAAQYMYSQDAILMVLASEEYDPTDYIRDYDEWKTLAANAGS